MRQSPAVPAEGASHSQVEPRREQRAEGLPSAAAVRQARDSPRADSRELQRHETNAARRLQNHVALFGKQRYRANIIQAH